MTIDANTYFVQYSNVAVGSSSACNLLSFNFTLDDTGGNFSCTSLTSPGNLGDNVNIFGFNGSITSSGKVANNSQVGVLTSGIFGNPKMNRQFQFLLAGDPWMYEVLTNQTLAAQSSKFFSASSAAKAIGSLVGANIIWAVPFDVRLTDTFTQGGDTAAGALSTLANMVGGVVRWDGNNTYLICLPNFITGQWRIPTDRLIMGLEYEYHEDLSRGVSGIGYTVIPQLLPFNPGINTLPTGGGTATPAIKKLWSTSKPFTSDDPDVFIDLPQDVAEVYMQILVQPGQGVSTGTTGPSFAATNLVTTDDSIWYNMGGVSISNPYAKISATGGNYKPQAKVNYTLFPSLDAVNNGNFVFSVGCTTNDLSGQFAKAQQDAQDTTQNILARTQYNFQFFKSYTGSLQTVFFGSIPLPGMLIQATVCNTAISGIIESVSFTSPGILNIQFANYLKIHYIQEYVNQSGGVIQQYNQLPPNYLPYVAS